MKLKRMLGILLALVMMLSVFPIGNVAFAEDGQGFDVTGSKTADPTELTSAQRETTVTLQLPSGEYKYVYDIVFVMDSSTSTANSKIDFSKSVMALLDDVKEKNIKLNVGVLKDRGLVFDTISLVTDKAQSGMIEYTADTKDTIEAAINVTEAELKALSSGTNMQGGLKKANEWLEADTAVPDDHKFVFLLTDGKTYIWNDENDIPTSVYGQYMAKNTVYPTPTVGQQTIAYSKSAYKFVDGVNFLSATADELANLSFDAYFEKTKNFYANDFAKLYASTNEELSQPTKYDYRCGYAYKEPNTAGGTATEHALTNANYTYKLHTKYYEFVPNADFAGLNWLQANPYTVEENEGVYSYTSTINPDFYQLHPDGLQKALYLTGHLWTDMVAKYNGVAIIYNGWGGGSGLEIAKSFNDWILADGISDYAAALSDADEVAQVFKTIKENILYMVSKGVVTDEIADDFTLKNDDNKDGFRMTYNGEALGVTFEDGQWYFGEAVDGVYPYSVAYDKETKTITWTINVPVENSKPITLDYDLVIRENAESDFYETNKSAVLNYTSTDGTKDGTFTFEVPVVSYIKLIDIPVQKVWENGDNWDGVTPESITVNLMEGEEPVQSIAISSEAQWTGVFEQVPDSRIVDGEIQSITYSVEEEDVEKYEAQIAKVTDDVKDGFVITNTHIPETIDITVEKAWDDGDGEYADRPESVKVQLYADKKAVGDPVELSEEGKWTYTWEKQFKYAAGKEIVYTVEEVETPDEYEAKVTGDAKDGFVITNKADAPIVYTITYVLNGGEFDGKPDDILEVYPADTEISIHEKPTREGYEFLYWEGSSYQPGDKYTVTEDHTFTAQWKKVDPDVPDTGDNEPVFYWYAILGVSLLGLFSVIVFDKKRKAAR